MDVRSLLTAYQRLGPTEQAVFAAMIRAHQEFNRPEWRDELARRHDALEGSAGVSLAAVEAFVRTMDPG